MEKQPAKYPIGIQTFAKIREDGYIYVDKTALIYKLVEKGQYYFLSRPRRFGKSLLLSTIKAYFEGHKELFKGLAIENMEKDWKAHPVLTLSLAAYNPSAGDIEELLDAAISEFELKYGKRFETKLLSARFGNLIKSAYEQTGNKVVILIDEYDAPLVAHLDSAKHEAIRDLLKSVYSNLKDMDAYIRFALITGVSRFSSMTIFSGINNLKDISLLPEWSEICGITETELRENFRDGIDTLAEIQQTDREGALALLKIRYDGYHFTAHSADIYNPFSLLNALNDSQLGAYWFRTGTPTFLVKQLSRLHEPLADIFNKKVPESTLSDIEGYHMSPVGLLFQTGYLTIKEADPRRRSYRLGIPNQEVEEGLLTDLLSNILQITKPQLDERLWIIREALENGDPEKALEAIRSFLSTIPGNVTAGKQELFFENNLFMLFRLIGIDTRAEW
ncbi:MAG: AAA family ATPase [Muribaculaceae bacterium]|nr:AAA family ATPase [Muribaculaceae bacterium]